MKVYLGDTPMSSGLKEPDKIIYSNKNKITVAVDVDMAAGETVYVIDNIAHLIPNGEFEELIYGAKVGFTLTNSANGFIDVIEVGEIAADYILDDALATQDDIISQIEAALEGKAIERG